MPSRRQLLAAAGSGLSATLAGCLDAAFDDDAGRAPDDPVRDWPLPHFDAAGTSYNPAPVGPTDEPTERWHVDIGWPSGRPAVVDGTVYVPTAEALLALDAESGDELWRVGPHAEERYGRPQFTSPAVVDGTVYVGTADRRGLLALSAENGEERWRFAPGGERDVRTAPVPTHDADSIVAGDDEGGVYALAPETGAEKWRYQAFGEVTALAYNHTTAAVGTFGGEVYSLYRGRGMWRRKLPGAIRALAMTGDDVYAGTFGGGVFRLTGGAHAGRTRWHAERGPVAHGAFVLGDGSLVGGDLSGADALDDRTGERQWSVDGTFGAAPAGAGDTVYLAGDRGVVACAVDGGVGVDDLRFGTKRWTYDLPGGVAEGVTVADDALFVPTHESEETPYRLYALE